MTATADTSVFPFDNTQAFQEGWGLFEMPADADPQFLDRYGAWSLDRLAEGNTAGPVVFGEDAEEAWRFVVGRALSGSPYHRDAIRFLRERNPKEIAFLRDDVPEVDRVH
jgi:hypothetical protein